MKYTGLFCQFKMTDSLISYRIIGLVVPLTRLRKFNTSIELPLNIIIGYEVKRYFPWSKGLTLTIQSSSQKRKIKRLRPINITFFPKRLVEKIIEQLDQEVQKKEVAQS